MLELGNNVRKQLSSDYDSKNIEALLAISMYVDCTQRILYAIARTTGTLYKVLQISGQENRVMYNFVGPTQQFSDDRQGLPQANIYLPDIFEAYYQGPNVYNINLPVDLRQNFIEPCEQAQEVLKMLPKNARVSTLS